jgi:hypothetical protein
VVQPLETRLFVIPDRRKERGNHFNNIRQAPPVSWMPMRWLISIRPRQRREGGKLKIPADNPSALASRIAPANETVRGKLRLQLQHTTTADRYRDDGRGRWGIRRGGSNFADATFGVLAITPRLSPTVSPAS